MKRREFLSAVASAAAGWPLATRAQRPAKLPTIGFLGANTAAVMSPWTAAFVRRLRELGWIEGRNVAIEYRWGGGRFDRSPEIMAEFVRLRVDVIVTHSTPNVVAARQATSVIPIVFAAAGDPVANNLVASLARPGGNATGLSLQQIDLAGKRLELLRQVLPGLRRVAFLANAGNPASVLEVGEAQAAAATLGLEAIVPQIRRAEDIAPAFDTLRRSAQGLYVSADPLLLTHQIRISTLALEARLPTLVPFRSFVEAGGLMSYGPDFADLFRRAGDFVDKILRGAKPADLPVEQPTKFELVLSLKTANGLGLTIPQSLLLRAEQVIQ